ncbi:MAG: hypothetical protein HQL37_00125 [Alphaproteobacteria bacterium]|nr:hypothetical protein [Alphaproteobacteria bacterium]
MELHEYFSGKGFLSSDIMESISIIRLENVEWFTLAADTNTVLMDCATAVVKIVKTTQMEAKAVAVRVMLRSCGTFQGVILLTERGMVVEGRTLARSLIENAFCVAALLNNPTEFIQKLKDDSAASKKHQSKYIIDKKLVDDTSANNLKNVINAIDRNCKILNPKAVSELGPLNKLYLSYQRLSNDAAHPTAKSLEHHVLTDAARSNWRYKWGPGGQGENAATLYHAISAAIPIGIGITEMLKDETGIDEFRTKFRDLMDRYYKMPPVPIV